MSTEGLNQCDVSPCTCWRTINLILNEGAVEETRFRPSYYLHRVGAVIKTIAVENSSDIRIKFQHVINHLFHDNATQIVLILFILHSGIWTLKYFEKAY